MLEVYEEFNFRGYTFTPSFDQEARSFTKTYNKPLGRYVVQFKVYPNYLHHVQFPYLLELPKQLQGRKLPHLLWFNGYRCCLFSDTSVLDPMNPRSLVAAWITKLEEIIELWESGDFNKDFYNEFFVYWTGKEYYLISDPRQHNDLTLYRYNRISPISGDSVAEYLICHSDEVAEQWSKLRNTKGDIDYVGDVVYLEMTHAPFVPFTRSWPPESTAEFKRWIFEGTEGEVLLEQLFEKISQLPLAKGNTSRKVVITLGFEDYAFGFEYQLLLEDQKCIRKYYGPKQKRARGKQSRDKLKERLLNSRSKVSRIKAIPAYHDFLTARNSRTPTLPLSSKRVALIGCGTIGGHLTKSLASLGAGSKFQFSLFDDDTFKPGNTTRHILGIPYYGENKAEALCHQLKKSFPQLKAIPRRRFFANENLNEFDILIDATGDHAFSLQLAKAVNQHRSNGNRISLVHSWISAFGHVAKALLNDNSNSACYACQFVYGSNGSKTEIYPGLKSSDIEEATQSFRKACGENVLPFGNEASMSAAGLALELLNNRSERSPKLLIRRITDKATNIKDKRIKKREDCPACGI